MVTGYVEYTCMGIAITQNDIWPYLKAHFTVAAWYQFDQFCLQNNNSAAEKL